MQIALLSGNPGLGKTTLAHIVAKHAGYNPVEMNARFLDLYNCNHFIVCENFEYVPIPTKVKI